MYALGKTAAILTCITSTLKTDACRMRHVRTQVERWNYMHTYTQTDKHIVIDRGELQQH